jgi:uncharacterized protein
MAGKFELKKASNGKFHFVLKAGNGEIILQSQLYAGKDTAMNGIESVRKNSADDAMFERKTSTKGEPYFSVKAKNGQIVGSSEMYSSARSMEGGIASVKKNAPDAALKDLTEG